MSKKTIFVILANILGGSMNITGGIVESNLYQFMLGLMFLIIALSIFVFEKAVKWRDDVIEEQNDCIKRQDKLITKLFEELAKPTVVIDLKNIKIPKKFTKPRKEKLEHRFKYYEKNKCFEVPIVIDKNYMLVDGYTSYLIAKKYNMKLVQARVKIGKENNNVV